MVLSALEKLKSSGRGLGRENEGDNAIWFRMVREESLCP